MSDHSKTNGENEQRREELTAYLDGELSAEVAAAVERHMASDDRYRSELQQLSAVWDCLDELSQKTADERFAQTTLEMVALSAEQDAERWQSQAPRRRWQTALLLAASCLMFMLASYALVQRWGQSPDRRLIADLPIVANLDLFQQIDNVAFLRRLHSEIVWNEEVPSSEPDFYHEGPNHKGLDARRREIRRVWIEELRADDKAALRNRRDRFEKLSGEEKHWLRQLHEAIAQEPNAQLLLATLSDYQRWLRDLSPGEHDDLQRLPADQRITKITSRLQNQRRRDQWQERITARLAEINRDISQADQQAIRRWASNYWRERRDQTEAGSPHESRHRMQHWRGASEGRELAQLRHLLDRSRGNGSLRLEAEQFRKLERRLSSRAQRKLSLVSSKSERQQMLGHWTEQTMRAGMMQRMLDPQHNGVREQDLEQFFIEELSSESRQRLLNLPRDQMKQELRRMYMRDVLGMTSPRGSPESRRGAPGGPPHDRTPRGGPRHGRPPPPRN